LRTIKGGICCGLTFLRTGSMQLRLLGYQQIVNNAGFKASLFFFNLADIVVHFSVNCAELTAHSSYRPILSPTFGNCV
jgi:hypothetical protein